MRRKPSDLGRSSSSGRLRLTILLATVAAFLLVPAAQAFAEGTLTVQIEGAGSGEVTSTGGFNGTGIGEGTPPIECSYASPGPATGTCEDELEFAEAFGLEAVALHETPAAGSLFKEWRIEEGLQIAFCGPGSSSGAESENCLVGEVEGGPAKVTAVFQEAGPKLTLNIEEGEGTVVSNPAGLECSGISPHSCSTESIAENTEVVLTASPASGYLFKSWKGCDAGKVNGRQCTVKLSAAKTVGVKFVKAPSLSLAKTTGSGPGIVSTSPGGVNCGYTCLSGTAQYKEGSLTIKAKPAKHFHLVEFKEGSGPAESCNGVSTETCTIASFTSNGGLKAQFAEDAKHTLSYAAEGGGQGSLKTKATGILCGYTCSAGAAEYFATETVEVSVTLNKGTSQLTWTTSAGTCTAHALTCTVPMSEDHSLVAKFE